jgi:hypothetical protein
MNGRGSEGRARLQPVPDDFLAVGEPDVVVRLDLLEGAVEPGDAVWYPEARACRTTSSSRTV